MLYGDALYTKMRSNTWDFVTIQAQSQEPAFGLNQVRAETFPYAKILADSIRSTNACAKPLFYMTWGRENGDARNCQFVPWICTYEGMDDSLYSRYMHMANVNEGLVSPVGRVWRYLRKNHPTVDLYTADESHPSATGSYVAMCAFYTTIFHKDPTAITYDYTVKAADAKIIREAAKLIVFDSLSNWNVGKFDPKADFSYTQNKDSIELTNKSTYTTNYKWTFGDGSTSTLKDPIYVYDSIGKFNLKLEAEQCGVTSTYSSIVDITELTKKDTANQDTTSNDTNTVYIQNFNFNDQLLIGPNPAKDYLLISGDFSALDYQIYDLSGAINLSGKIEDERSKINLESLKSGVYLFRITNNRNITQTHRIVIQRQSIY